MTKNHILFIDDEPVILEAARIYFSQAGFELSSYTSADTALTEHKDSQFESFHCAVVDIELPGMSGTEFADHLQHCRHDLPIIFISGFAAQPILASSNPESCHFISKPFQFSELIQKVQQLTGKS